MSPERSAALVVAEHAKDAADARLLLWYVGLLDTPPETEHAPLACGHPWTSLRRREPPQRGSECVDCKHAVDRVRSARQRQRRVKR